MTVIHRPAAATGSPGIGPAINGAFAPRSDIPHRIQRTRRRFNFTPPGAVYVGRPTLWSNPFSGRARIGHKRSVILYRAWVTGSLDPSTLLRIGVFSEAEVFALRRWRDRLIAALPQLRGRNLQCWCPLTSDWCHAETLLRLANPRLGVTP
ncbi:DUF4326 domain-containing protein [Sphingosinithalassobacter portus]|uniref:DUF4326 domain-containing protein n=1 Tax=Stakelama portus TaxID=2676234 RepID=UPI000D6E321C|nr:DUF4326 domain-containing protein [Sphingosinithalassobacter portus]